MRTSSLMEAINGGRWDDALRWAQWSDEEWCCKVAEGVAYAGYTALHLAAQKVPPNEWMHHTLLYDTLALKALT